MGRTGSSSSKRKSSKNKIPKSSSEARRKKKSRKNKSKKLRRHDDSVSSYSDDESTSSLSSSSGDDYKSRKARSRTRGDVKGSKKRVGRRSSSRGSSIDSPRVKKIKCVKRNGDSETMKRRPKKKSKTKKNKQRRDASASSVSNDTHSCSTCQVGSGSSSSSEEIESERLRGRSREKKKEMRHSGKARSGAKKSRDRSRSCSSCKLSDSIGNNSIDNFTVENNSRRLRSVITIAPRVEEREGNEENKDECKEEIVYDHDDYPSCRSNDSNDGGNKRDSSHRRVENLMGEVSSVSNLITAKPASTSKNVSDKYDERHRISDGAGNVSPKDKEGDVKDLESILRQRALENLKRFRGVRQTNEVVPVDERSKSNSEMKPVPTVTAAVVQNNQLSQENLTALPQSAARRSRFTWRRDSSLPTGTEENIPPDTVKRTVASLPDSSFSGGFEEKDINLASVNGSESVRSQTSRLWKLTTANSSLNSSSVNESVGGNSQTLIESTSNGRKLGISDGHGSTPLETPSSILAEEGSSKQQENEAKDSSQFQQKTMSVMRGGEMVQVSYKVYIPKKVPALARRQLRR